MCSMLECIQVLDLLLLVTELRNVRIDGILLLLWKKSNSKASKEAKLASKPANALSLGAVSFLGLTARRLASNK